MQCDEPTDIQTSTLLSLQRRRFADVQWCSQPKLLEGQNVRLRQKTVFCWDTASQSTKWLDLLKICGGHYPLATRMPTSLLIMRIEEIHGHNYFLRVTLARPTWPCYTRETQSTVASAQVLLEVVSLRWSATAHNTLTVFYSASLNSLNLPRLFCVSSSLFLPINYNEIKQCITPQNKVDNMS